MMTASESQAKKAYLRSYRKCLLHEKVLEEQLEELRFRYGLPRALTYDDMPKGTRQGDLSDFAVLYFDLMDELAKAARKTAETRYDITRRIEAMKNETEKTLLYLRYIKNMRFDEIGAKLGYSIRHTARIHGDALRHFEI